MVPAVPSEEEAEAAEEAEAKEKLKKEEVTSLLCTASTVFAKHA